MTIMNLLSRRRSFGPLSRWLDCIWCKVRIVVAVVVAECVCGVSRSLGRGPVDTCVDVCPVLSLQARTAEIRGQFGIPLELRICITILNYDYCYYWRLSSV